MLVLRLSKFWLCLLLILALLSTFWRLWCMSIARGAERFGPFLLIKTPLRNEPGKVKSLIISSYLRNAPELPQNSTLSEFYAAFCSSLWVVHFQWSTLEQLLGFVCFNLGALSTIGLHEFGATKLNTSHWAWTGLSSALTLCLRQAVKLAGKTGASECVAGPVFSLVGYMLHNLGLLSYPFYLTGSDHWRLQVARALAVVISCSPSPTVWWLLAWCCQQHWSIHPL